MRYRVALPFVCVFVIAGASKVGAQGSWGDLAVSVGRMDYDLSGTGHVPSFAVRATRDFSSNVALEFGGVFAKPHQPFGTSTLFMPEAQIRYRWNLGRVSPYVGGGLGTALVKSSFHTDWDPTLSVAGGTGVRLTDRVAVTGELRIRNHGWDFGGTTTDLSAGLAWRLPSF